MQPLKKQINDHFTDLVLGGYVRRFEKAHCKSQLFQQRALVQI